MSVFLDMLEISVIIFQNYNFVYSNMRNLLAIPFHMEIITSVASTVGCCTSGFTFKKFQAKPLQMHEKLSEVDAHGLPQS